MHTVPVVIVGGGPTGITAATLLGQYGIECTVLERYPAIYPLPRAVALDEEIYRILARLGVQDEFAAMSWPCDGLRLVTRDKQVLAEFRARGLAIHPSKPVREKIIRARSAYVPAVLRYNAVPAKALLEVCNLANAEDRRLLQTRAFRQRVAEAVVEGILAYYGADGRGAPQTVTAAAK